MYGWVGKILRINLTDKKVSVENLNEEDLKKYIGARGLGTKIMCDEVKPEVDPLSAENKIIFATGPLTGTYATSGGRYDVVTKGPLTGTIAASNSGGYFGPEIKYAGYDVIIFEGKSEEPVYVSIYNDTVEIKDAKHLWGKNTHETVEMVTQETGDNYKVACIGPAGEKQVLFSCIINDMHRAAGRSGIGAVMGSKNLKALAVRGTKGVKVADGEKFKEAVLKARKILSEHPVASGGLPTFGTNVLVEIINEAGAMPTRNFQDAYFENAEKIGGPSLKDNLTVRNKGCMGCSIGCGRVTSIKEGKFKGEGEGPEYESTWAFGAQCGVDDIEAITKANYICNELGIDTITMGSTIACLMELAEKGYATEEEIGMKLQFGDADVLVDLTEKTAYKEGIGEKLAQGSYRMAESYGVPELSMSVKKQEMPAYDPRGTQGIGLEYATSNRGGCHVRGYLISPEILGVPEKVDQHVTEGKAGLLKIFQDLTAALDASGICLFTTFGLGADEIAAMLSAATGLDISTEEFMKIGDRIWNLEKIYNLKAGITPEEDKLPKRLLNEPVKSGPSKGRVSKLNEMLGEYYDLRGWDEKGVPKEEKLAELGI